MKIYKSIPIVFFLVLSGNIYADDEERDLLSELSPKLYTYLISNYYDIQRLHDSPNYKKHIEPIFLELGCELNENNLESFNDILLNAQTASEFAQQVSQDFECH
ncbi:hypothetical protein ACFL3P_04465 [Pseudomonadota bacterium]